MTERSKVFVLVERSTVHVWECGWECVCVCLSLSRFNPRILTDCHAIRNQRTCTKSRVASESTVHRDTNLLSEYLTGLLLVLSNSSYQLMISTVFISFQRVIWRNFLKWNTVIYLLSHLIFTVFTEVLVGFRWQLLRMGEGAASVKATHFKLIVGASLPLATWENTSSVSCLNTGSSLSTFVYKNN